MNIDKKIAEEVNSSVNAIIARFLVAVFVIVAIVTVMTYTEIFLATVFQMNILFLTTIPCAVIGFLVLHLKQARNSGKTKYLLCILMTIEAFVAAMVGYSYIGTVILLLPVLLAALYPKSKVGVVVTVTMIACGIIVPPLSLMAGLWEGGYFEFLYDLSFGRQMDTATLSNEMLSQTEQIMSAIRFCSAQNVLIVGGFSVIGRLLHRRANKAFDSQRDVLRLSEIDVLTGLLNRNCFERKLNEIAAANVGNLVCFYFDVNGLHEMNNKNGHKAGDTMLQFVGKKIQETFGEEDTFRVGGDEYVAFSGDLAAESLPGIKESLEKTFKSQNYHVAIGYAQGTAGDDVNRLVQLAEKEMFQAKSMHYIMHDRRR